MLNFVLFSLPNFNFPLEATFWYARAVFDSRFTNYLPSQTKLNKGNKYSNQKPFVYYTHFLSMIWCSLIQRQLTNLSAAFLNGIFEEFHCHLFFLIKGIHWEFWWNLIDWKTIVFFFSTIMHNHGIVQEFRSQFHWDSIKIPVGKVADFA